MKNKINKKELFNVMFTCSIPITIEIKHCYFKTNLEQTWEKKDAIETKKALKKLKSPGRC